MDLTRVSDYSTFLEKTRKSYMNELSMYKGDNESIKNTLLTSQYQQTVKDFEFKDISAKLYQLY
jgi:hypothetical protein